VNRTMKKAFMGVNKFDEIPDPSREPFKSLAYIAASLGYFLIPFLAIFLLERGSITSKIGFVILGSWLFLTGGGWILLPFSGVGCDCDWA
jgi:hypothetical protein